MGTPFGSGNLRRTTIKSRARDWNVLMFAIPHLEPVLGPDLVMRYDRMLSYVNASCRSYSIAYGNEFNEHEHLYLLLIMVDLVSGGRQCGMYAPLR